MDYVSLAMDFVRRHAKAIVALVAGFVLLREFRAVLMLGLVLLGVYYFVPDVRPYWQSALQMFLAGLSQLV